MRAYSTAAPESFGHGSEKLWQGLGGGCQSTRHARVRDGVAVDCTCSSQRWGNQGRRSFGAFSHPLAIRVSGSRRYGGLPPDVLEQSMARSRGHALLYCTPFGVVVGRFIAYAHGCCLVDALRPRSSGGGKGREARTLLVPPCPQPPHLSPTPALTWGLGPEYTVLTAWRVVHRMGLCFMTCLPHKPSWRWGILDSPTAQHLGA